MLTTTPLSEVLSSHYCRTTFKNNAHITPCPCRTPTMPLCKQLLTAMVQHSRTTAWCVCINSGRLSTACGRSAQFRFLPTITRSFTIGSSDFSGYTRTFTMVRYCRRTAAAQHGTCELARHGTTGARYGMCELAFRQHHTPQVHLPAYRYW